MTNFLAEVIRHGREAGRPKRSGTYIFFGTEGVADVPGVSCATPVYAADGSLRGVLTSSFDLIALCGFLTGADLRAPKP